MPLWSVGALLPGLYGDQTTGSRQLKVTAGCGLGVGLGGGMGVGETGAAEVAGVVRAGADVDGVGSVALDRGTAPPHAAIRTIATSPSARIVGFERERLALVTEHPDLGHRLRRLDESALSDQAFRLWTRSPPR